MARTIGYEVCHTPGDGLVWGVAEGWDGKSSQRHGLKVPKGVTGRVVLKRQPDSVAGDGSALDLHPFGRLVTSPPT